MEFIFSEAVLVGTTIVSGVAFLWDKRGQANQKHADRMAQLQLATRAMKEHGLKLDSLLFSQEISDALKAFLMEASDAFEDREIVHGLIEHARKGRNLPQEENDDDDVVREYLSLTKTNPEAADLFRECLARGMMAAVLRWESTTEALLAATEIEGSAKREVVVAARARRMYESRGKPMACYPDCDVVMA